MKRGLAINEDGTITDHGAGLMWQAVDDGVERNFEDAVSYCLNLRLAGHDDWRLPMLDEFRSLASAAKEEKVTANVLYNRETNAEYWSATPGPQRNVAFIADGTTMFRDNPYAVRAVRNV